MRNVKRAAVRPRAKRYGGNPYGHDGLTMAQIVALSFITLAMLLVMNANRPACSAFNHISKWDKATVQDYATCKK